MQQPNDVKFVLLVVLDGWGIAAAGPGNAIAQANTPNMNRFVATYPHTTLLASGEAVGLPPHEVGNTETGHLNLGAGRIVYQDLERINRSIADGSFFENKVLIGAIDHAIKNNSNLHYMGLIGGGGVHSSINHLYALIQLAKKKNFNRLYFHLFTDGRDSPPASALIYINELKKIMEKEQIGQIASIMGRYWAMDRDRRWDRTEKAYLALTKGEGHLYKTVEEIINDSYSEGKQDEFIEPSLIAPNGIPIALIKENDSVIFFNFRIDRPRQLTSVFVLNDFSKANSSFGFDPYQVNFTKKHQEEIKPEQNIVFNRGEKIKNLYFATMTQYSKILEDDGANVAFPPEIVTMPLGRVVSEAGFTQLRMAESEKERFVTFYFNGQSEITYIGEQRIIIPSPKVATYDKKPEMSARELTETLTKQLSDPGNTNKFILLNFANADMVGHTGSIGAAVTACEVIDECLGKLASFISAYNGAMIITADHGNAEEMIDHQNGQIETKHSGNPVPFIAISKHFFGKPQVLQSGILADVAPTIVKLLKLEVPSSMTGRNLLERLS
ncbi:2,3-bisphosphoglycerate-independent phosphoglycerate mutase [soil metagenome]